MPSLLLSTLALLPVTASASPPQTPAQATKPEASSESSSPETEPETEPASSTVELAPPATMSQPERAPTPQVEPAPQVEAESHAELAPEPVVRLDGGFSLDKGAWLSTPHFEFGIGLLATMRYGASFNSDGVDNLGFTLPFIRPNIHGGAFDDKLRFLIQPELANTPRLLDAQVVYQPIPAFGVDVGQYRPHVSRAWNTPIPLLALPGRGTVDDSFHSDRAAGATVFGKPLDGKLEYDVGLLNAGGYNLATPTKLQPLLTWRLAYNPLGAMPLTQTPAFAKVERTLIGFSTHGWSDKYTTTPTDPNIKPSERQRVTVGGDFALLTPRVHVLVEGFGRWEANKTGLRNASWGSQAQLGVMLLPQTLELQARGGVLDQGINKPLTGIWEGGLTWYLLGNHLRAQLHYMCTQNLGDPSGCSQHRAELQTQLWF